MTLRRKLIDWIKSRFRLYSLTETVTRKKRQFARLFYRRKYFTADIMAILQRAGIKEGDTILFHSSWNEFYNYTGTIDDLIKALLALLGPGGTLMMPCFPFLRKPGQVFDLERTPTLAGLVPETFRHYPGVERSMSMHSVCAVGPNTHFLLGQHVESETVWDKKSPYYKLGEVGGKVVALGLGRTFVGTIMHCADSILKDELPYFAQFFSHKRENVFRAKGQMVTQTDWTSPPGFDLRFTNRHHRAHVRRYYDRTKYSRLRLSNLTVNVYDAKYFIARTTELARRGLVVYHRPKPKKYFG